MKKTLQIYLSAALLFGAVASNAALLVSNTSSVPTENVTINQALFNGGSTQSRNRKGDLSDWRGIQQTFVWNSNNKLDGIGIRVDADQGSFDPFNDAQQHVLYIQSVNGLSADTNPIYTATFTLSASQVRTNEYIYLDLDDVTLVNGYEYGFSLCPVASAADSQRIYWSRSADDSAYIDGEAAQFNPNNDGLPDSTYGDQNQDLTFYMTQVPEPTSLAVLSVASLAIVFVRKIFCS